MEFNTLPLFKSQYSLGRSILTLSQSSDSEGPDSIFSLLKENDLSEFYLIDDTMSGFLEAYNNSKEQGVKMRYGLRITICEDIEDKSTDSLNKECKYIIFVKNLSGYKRLIKIYTTASTSGFYYQPRIDFKTLKTFWDEKDLMLCVPFYDSFLYRNTLEDALCVSDFTFCEPKFFEENNNLPFDNILKNKVKDYTSDNSYEIIKTKSIYYNKKKDFKAYLTFRCINNRSSLNKPNLEHMCSDEFSFESWKEL
jgi:DNA polymerase-3 subunit alpha